MSKLAPKKKRKNATATALKQLNKLIKELGFAIEGLQDAEFSFGHTAKQAIEKAQLITELSRANSRLAWCENLIVGLYGPQALSTAPPR